MRFALASVLMFIMLPLTGSLAFVEEVEQGLILRDGWSTQIPSVESKVWNDAPWWETTSLDMNRNQIHDSLESAEERVNVGLSFSRDVTTTDVETIESMGFNVKYSMDYVDAVLLGDVSPEQVWSLSEIDGVVMVERYGMLTFYGDVQTPAIKAEPSSVYPVAAWNLTPGKGAGQVIAMVDTGVDNEHPGLNTKFVAGYDAVCATDPMCVLNGGREDDGSFDPDDAHQHGTGCMGMASATGLDASGEQTGYEGSAPNASLADVRIGTDIGAGPFENYLIEQEFYESAMNGLNWAIDNRDTAWPGVDESLHGIDIISLSWGITSHESGGSDGQDMHSRVLDTATQMGMAVSVAAGNDGPDNDGLSGMGSSDLAITVGATDDMNTIERSDDEIASYSSRGPRRDDGDSNPIDELKPDVSAPGTNIVQAEACITSDGCHNSLGMDASQNGYTDRGSGTSYATPAVSGVIALMWEVNPDLDPLTIREILRMTAERPAPPTYPDIDPHWNRDFGWGMVDAYEAVKMAKGLREVNLTSTDLDIQIHTSSESLDLENHTYLLEGYAWTRSQSITAIEYRIDDGEWQEAMYQSESGNVSTFETFNWSVQLDTRSLGEGEHTIQVRGVGEDGSESIYVMSELVGQAKIGDGTQGLSKIVIIGSLITVILLFGAFIALASADPVDLEKYLLVKQPKVLDAELLEEMNPGGD